jgi:hypothetical protein
MRPKASELSISTLFSSPSLMSHCVLHRQQARCVYRRIRAVFHTTKSNSLKISKGVIRIRKSKKNRQYNDQKEKRQKDKQQYTK